MIYFDATQCNNDLGISQDLAFHNIQFRGVRFLFISVLFWKYFNLPRSIRWNASHAAGWCEFTFKTIKREEENEDAVYVRSLIY